MKRTNIDFSQHRLKITEFQGTAIYEFKKPDSITNMLVFINSCGVLSVTDDFGNWIFCREFHPSPENHVSDCYWDEKLEIGSRQTSESFDTDETIKSIEEFEKQFDDYYGRSMNEEEKDWLEELKQAVDDETDYTYTAYREKPGNIDYEHVPFGKKRHRWLDVVYDGFDCICELMATIKENHKKESYPDRLEREIKELQEKYPGCKKMIDAMRKAYSMSNAEIDYFIEKDAAAYRAFKEFMESKTSQEPL